MKIWIPMLILFVASLTLIVWDGIHNDNVFEYLEKESEHIYSSLLTDDISNENIQNKIHNLSNYWTKEMDMLSISISRKDMQSISDYLQYLYASTINNNQEDAITYSRLLLYNVQGVRESSGISGLNIL